MHHLTLLLLALALTACAAEPLPSSAPLPELLPLPAAVRARPGGPTFEVRPASRRGDLTPAVAVRFVLGHCGLLSPIDVDGSLWNPAGGDDGSGRPLNEDHIGELINSTTVSFTLLTSQAAQLDTPRGARILLIRNDGPGAYPACD
ncbi:hypothetical protein BH24CHL5_BH24CHL5_11630 [soil metagenome]